MTVPDLIANIVPAGSVFPFIVGEVRCPHGTITLAFRPMTGCAIVRKQWLGALNGPCVGGTTRYMHDIFHQIVDLRGLEDSVAAECRHLGLARMRTGGAHPDRDCLFDVGQFSAPKPDIVIQVGIAMRTLSAG